MGEATDAFVLGNQADAITEILQMKQSTYCFHEESEANQAHMFPYHAIDTSATLLFVQRAVGQSVSPLVSLISVDLVLAKPLRLPLRRAPPLVGDLPRVVRPISLLRKIIPTKIP